MVFMNRSLELGANGVYVMTGEKLKILHTLCGKLLTLVSTRDFIEDCADEQRAAKMELREIKAEQHRREREEAAIRYCHFLRELRVHTQLHYTIPTLSILQETCICFYINAAKNNGLW